jgi:hypothetical protein
MWRPSRVWTRSRVGDRRNNPSSRLRIRWAGSTTTSASAAIEENLEAVRLGGGRPGNPLLGELNLADCYLAVGRLDESRAPRARDPGISSRGSARRPVDALALCAPVREPGRLALIAATSRAPPLGRCMRAAAQESGSPGTREGFAPTERPCRAEKVRQEPAGLHRPSSWLQVETHSRSGAHAAASSDAGAQGLDDGAAALANEALVVVEAVASSLGAAPLAATLRTSPPVVALRSRAVWYDPKAGRPSAEADPRSSRR